MILRYSNSIKESFLNFKSALLNEIDGDSCIDLSTFPQQITLSKLLKSYVRYYLFKGEVAYNSLNYLINYNKADKCLDVFLINNNNELVPLFYRLEKENNTFFIKKSMSKEELKLIKFYCKNVGIDMEEIDLFYSDRNVFLENKVIPKKVSSEFIANLFRSTEKQTAQETSNTMNNEVAENELYF